VGLRPLNQGMPCPDSHGIPHRTSDFRMV
jgi:hypothetical protein